MRKPEPLPGPDPGLHTGRYFHRHLRPLGQSCLLRPSIDPANSKLYITLQKPRHAETRPPHITITATAEQPNRGARYHVSDTPDEGPQPGSGIPFRRRRRWLFAAMIGVAGILGFAAGKVHSSPWMHHWAHSIAWMPMKSPSSCSTASTRRCRRWMPRRSSAPRSMPSQRLRSAMSLRCARDPDARREKVVAILKADTIDRAALEEIRAERLSAGETASKRIVQAIADAADVLKPEQRRELRGRVGALAPSAMTASRTNGEYPAAQQPPIIPDPFYKGRGEFAQVIRTTMTARPYSLFPQSARGLPRWRYPARRSGRGGQPNRASNL